MTAQRYGRRNGTVQGVAGIGIAALLAFQSFGPRAEPMHTVSGITTTAPSDKAPPPVEEAKPPQPVRQGIPLEQSDLKPGNLSPDCEKPSCGDGVCNREKGEGDKKSATYCAEDCSPSKPTGTAARKSGKAAACDVGAPGMSDLLDKIRRKILSLSEILKKDVCDKDDSIHVKVDLTVSNYTVHVNAVTVKCDNSTKEPPSLLTQAFEHLVSGSSVEIPGKCTTSITASATRNQPDR